jgi:hypothetical protein
LIYIFIAVYVCADVAITGFNAVAINASVDLTNFCTNILDLSAVVLAVIYSFFVDEYYHVLLAYIVS